MTPVRFKPAVPRSQVKYSTTEPLHSLEMLFIENIQGKPYAVDLFCLFLLMLSVPVNGFPVMSGHFLG